MFRVGVAAALLARCALASPYPQDFDWDAIDALDPYPTATIPVVDAAAAQTTISFQPTVAASEVSSAVLADPTNATIQRRQSSNNIQCASQPSSSDTSDNWSSQADWASAANGATTPSGYQLAYQNANGSSIGVYGYMGYSTLSSYDVLTCSQRCDAILGCQSFNVYYERDPSEEPRTNCTNPASVTVIKCVYYGGPVTAASATNVGQWRDDFHVVIAGSNGYVNNSISTPTGYRNAVAMGNAAINSPNDCNGSPSYMTVKIFQSGIFSVEKCAAACSAQSAYNRAHPARNGFFQTCQFFNTYVLYNNSASVGQYCALYNETWPAPFATNKGQWRGPNFYSIGYSYAFSNTTANLDQPVGCANPSAPK